MPTGAVRAERRGGKLAAPRTSRRVGTSGHFGCASPQGRLGTSARSASIMVRRRDGRCTEPRPWRQQRKDMYQRRRLQHGSLRRRTGRPCTDGSGWGPLRRLPQASAGVLAHRASGPRKKRPAKRALITEFLRPARASTGTSEVVSTPPLAPMGDEPILVDLSESLLALQSALGPYWGRGVSRKYGQWPRNVSQVQASGRGRIGRR